MRTSFLVLAFCLFSGAVMAQSYNDSILAFRQHYKQDFLTDKRSPLKSADLKYLRFFEPDISYRVKASFVATPESPSFSMPTHSGKDKTYRQYGILTFRLHDTLLNLSIYKRLDANTEPKDYLFVPFTDLTSYTETFGGGRYLDLSVNDIKDNQVLLDFNKCYNPYCAFAEGYACPIPPRENALNIAIKAGEKIYGKNLLDLQE